MEQNSLFARDIHPFKQAAFVLAAIFVFTGFMKLLEVTGLTAKDPMLPWIVSGAFLLFFAMFNAVFSLSAKKPGKYWFLSLIAYAFIALAGGFFAYLLSGLSINEAKSMRWIYTVFTIGYIVLITIFRLMKTIVSLVLKQDKRLRGEE